MTFEAGDAWMEELKSALLMQPPPGHRPVSWPQIRAADEALWKFVASKCEGGTKAQPGQSVTAFETAWREGMSNLHVRQHLNFLQGSSTNLQNSSSSSNSPSAA